MEYPKVSPIAMFVYNRLDNVRQTIDCLLKNTFAPQTELYVFSDGGKDEQSWKEVDAVRGFILELKHQEDGRGLKKISLIPRPENYYLERNITEGISQILSTYDRIVVLEDDICTSPYFLEFMNDALNHYEAEKSVMHISGFTNLDIPQKGDVYFTPHMAGWGWATWRDRWCGSFVHFKSRSEALAGMTDEMCRKIEYHGKFPCLKSLDRNPIPWDICWEVAICKNHALCLSPTQTLVRNCGIHNGTHFHAQDIFGRYEYDRPYTTRKLDVAKSPIHEDEEIETVLNPAALTDNGFRYNPFGKIIRFFYLRLFKKKD